MLVKRKTSANASGRWGPQRKGCADRPPLALGWLVWCLWAVIATVGDPLEAAESTLAYPGASGRLLYDSREVGDRLPNFSSVGYQYGEAPLPTIPSVVVVEPGPGDDTALIQNAIQTVAAMPLGPDGFRGAVQLGPGEFQIGSSLQISSSGIVLRGSGNSDSGTVLRATGTGQRTLVNVSSSGGRVKDFSSEQPILDKYVPVGATSFRVADPGQYTVGDEVVVFRPSTANWISELGMDMIPPRPDGGTVVQWTPGSKNLLSDRRVTRVEGDRVFINAPLTNSLDQQYGGGTIYKYTFPNRLENIGIEHIKSVSDYDLANSFDEDHAWTFIKMDDTHNGWVRDITARHYGLNAVNIEKNTTNVTITDAHFEQPVSLITGGRRYAFEIDGQLNIVRDSTSEFGRHDFMLNSPSPGPNVFLDSVATNTLDETGPHQRWSTGGLFDNITVEGDQINAYNRGYFGTGHGWAGANMVVWNSNAESYIIQNPPTAQNWLIGSVGTVLEDDRFGPQELGIIDQHGAPVDTRSLYLKQHDDRLAIEGSQMREYTTGDYDLFEADGPGSVDDPFVSQNLLDDFDPLLTSGLPVLGFDDLSTRAYVPFSWQFELAPEEQVFHASMSIALRKSGGMTLDDTLWYESLGNQLSLLFDLGITTEISETESTILVMEFSGTDLAWFQDGEFNVLLGNDVGVDWSRLELTVAPRLIGDFDFDGTLTADDVDSLCAAVGGNDLAFDLNGDGQVTAADVEQWVVDEFGTLLADANLDGIVDGADFIAWNNNKFSNDNGWSGADFNCDGVTDGRDFIIWNSNKFQTASDGLAVPEPLLSGCWLGLALGVLWRMRRRA
ncbi:MAG: hypothetical protein AAGF97_13970 [Planctomycetota bacterium]